VKEPYDLWYIVESVKQDIDLLNTRHDLKLFKWAIDGYKELNCYNVLKTHRTVKIAMNADGTIYLPDDCEFGSIIKIGVCVNGYIVNFWANEEICLKKKEACDCDTITNTISSITAGVFEGEHSWFYLPYHHNNQFVAGMYGLGEGFYGGGFRFNEERGVIQFDSYVKASHVIVEYKSDGEISINGNAYIPELAIRPLRNYVHRERCQFEIAPDRRMTALLRQDAIKFGQRYANGLKAAIAKIRGMTHTEILDIYRNSLTQLPKR